MTRLFAPLALRGVTLRHRIVIPPMVMYRAGRDGLANDWHLVHYGRLAMGGASMVIVESTQVEERGRIGYADLGLWNDGQIAPLRRVAEFIEAQDCVAGIQLNHAGRKAGWRRPWDVYIPLDEEDARVRGEPPWPTVGPSAIAVSTDKAAPCELGVGDIREIAGAFAAAARRAHRAGFRVLEIHAAHGYLIHQFLSPLSNVRGDGYGGSLPARMRFALEVAQAVREAWPHDKPLLVRVSCVDGIEGGWSLDDTVVLASELKARGVDVIDCSSGGLGGSATVTRLPRGPGFQVPFAERVRREAGMTTIAVGLITTPELAAEIVDDGHADIVAIGREALVDPNWPSAARTHLEPERGFAHWPRESGWWLDRRLESLHASRQAA
jgi:2,4-dienoyl-CoA reductase-like NADH-dependent reductase (Old Yellow Enzyme family)